MIRPALLAVDGGGSKVDAALLKKDGSVLGAARVAATGFDTPGDPEFLTMIGNAVHASIVDAGLDVDGHPVAELGVLCL